MILRVLSPLLVLPLQLPLIQVPNPLVRRLALESRTHLLGLFLGPPPTALLLALHFGLRLRLGKLFGGRTHDRLKMLRSRKGMREG